MNEAKERAVFWWILLATVAAFWIIIDLWFRVGSAQAADTVAMTCDPPTHRVANGDCGQQGTPLTAEDLAALTYTFSYRQVGVGAAWVNIESSTPSVALTLAGYGVLYEVVVGASFPGGPILCVTDPPLEYRTDPDTSAPGPCSAFGINKVVQ